MEISALGQRTLLLRRERKLSQSQLAQLIGVTKNTIARLERGEIQDLKGGTVLLLSKEFGIQMNRFYDPIEIGDKDVY